MVKLVKDNHALGDGPMTWNLFKKAFIDKFFPREQREAIVEELSTFVKEV